MGDFITVLILILAIAFVALLIYSKVKEARGKECSGCGGCANRESCGTEQTSTCAEYKQEVEAEEEPKDNS